MNSRVPETVVTKQEIVAHVFVALDGPLAGEAEASVRGMWDRFGRLQGANQPLGAGVPARIPGVLPTAPHGSVVVAGVQDAERLDQAILRRHHALLNLSVLLGAAPGRAWPELEQRVGDVLGPLGEPHVGAVVLLLGEVSGAAPDELELSEPVRGEDTRAIRRLRLVGAAGQDHRLGVWAWSAGGKPEMPPFVRYLMYVAAIRHQLRTHRRFAEGGPNGVLQVPYAGAPDVLENPADKLRALRRGVDSAWDNARQALRQCGGARAGHLAGTEVLHDDWEFVTWFAQHLDDSAAMVAMTRDRTAVEPSAPAGEETLPDGDAPAVEWPVAPVRVLAVIDEWFPAHGGVSAFNRQLCIALAAAGAQVYTLVAAPSAEERADAEAAGVRLLAAGQPGHTGGEALMRRARLPQGVVPDLVIGHGRVSGTAARAQAEDHFPGSRRLHFLHVEPDQAEWHKPDRADDAGARAQARTDLELELGRGALRMMPVGPRLEAVLLREGVPENEYLPPTVRIDPGFDTGLDAASPAGGPVRDGPGGAPAAPRVPPYGVPQILVMGRLEDARVKGLDIACRAVGRAAPANSRPGSWELLIRGAPEGQSGPLHKEAHEWLGNPAVDVTVRPYSPELPRIRRDVARASLVLMPSRAEAFGLVGLEAVIAGVPVLVSGRSGLGMLLREVLPAEVSEQVVVDVDGHEERAEGDTAAWERAVTSVMFDRRAAFVRAAHLRSAMARHVTWGAAAARVLECARTPDAPRTAD